MMNEFEKEKENIIDDILAQLTNKFKHGQDHKSFIIQCIQDLQPPEIEFESLEWFIPYCANTNCQCNSIVGIFRIDIHGQLFLDDDVIEECSYGDEDLNAEYLKPFAQAHHDALILSRIKK